MLLLLSRIFQDVVEALEKLDLPTVLFDSLGYRQEIRRSLRCLLRILMIMPLSPSFLGGF